ncbi:MAG TPA: tRNA lysidine(34) synthetase TilS [Kribbellaceae bacterium]|nr:tRNA lysidine(34) synthetase TilS [Kribbellaceae bacterium]
MRPRLDPPTAATREAVREVLDGLPHEALVLVACSGGADSLALAAATAFVAPKLGLRAGAVIVDHGLQPESDKVARAAADQCRGLGLDPVRLVPVEVGTTGGPEAAARAARYDALDDEADRLGADVVLLGHTRDDQAETVLLGLARGSGARSLAGMAPIAGRLRRPFLGLDRATTEAACEPAGLEPWDDPHNSDSSYTRVRVRREVLPVLEDALGPGIAAALARTAGLLRADADALDALAADLSQTALRREGSLVECGVAALESEPQALRTRVLRLAALAAGSRATDLTAGHVAAVEQLVTGWRGQRWVDLPQGVRAIRRGGSGADAVIVLGRDLTP